MREMEDDTLTTLIVTSSIVGIMMCITIAVCLKTRVCLKKKKQERISVQYNNTNKRISLKHTDKMSRAYSIVSSLENITEDKSTKTVDNGKPDSYRDDYEETCVGEAYDVLRGERSRELAKEEDGLVSVYDRAHNIESGFYDITANCNEKILPTPNDDYDIVMNVAVNKSEDEDEDEN